MPVYLLALQNATCRSEGCLCHDRVASYPSDLSDDEWKVLEPQAREVMRELVRVQGRPMDHDLRAVCDAVAYLVRNGIEWRALPVDFLSVTWNHTACPCARAEYRPIASRRLARRGAGDAGGAGGQVACAGQASGRGGMAADLG